MPTRRSFLRSTMATAATVSASAFADSGKTKGSQNQFCFFSKPFNSISFEQLAQKTKALGFNGIEAPIRKGGHVEPEAVPDELPKLAEALKAQGRQITVMTSDINDPADPLTESVLKTAASLGIRYYRMKYFKYEEAKPIRSQISEWKRQFKDLAALNKQLGVTAVYQNHAGKNYFGAPVWDLKLALEDLNPNYVGMAYDIRHATAEAGMSWPTGFQLLRPHIKVVYVKDFVWGEWKPTNVPLGEGRVDPKFFQMLAKTKFDGPISLHEEYLDHRKPDLVPDHWAAIERDFATLKSWTASQPNSK